MMQKRAVTWKPTLHKKRSDTSGNPGRWTIKEGGWESFILIEREFAHLEKMTKGTTAKKVSLKSSI